ncbi:MAG TPA: HNH endonuclease [Solirubrobacterales bacterium]|nr:HNH endonuclease [Solirubrobacterales bacterium]
MSLSRKTAMRPGPTRPRAVTAIPRVAASPAQRRKVAELRCLVCGRTPVDPAHLVPRRLGGCDSPECVVALCRTHHRMFDTGGLALAPYLGPELEGEIRHALGHVSCAELEPALRRGWPAPWAGGEPMTTDDGGR